MPRLFCFGLGRSAECLARRLQADGWEIAGTVREAQRLAALTSLGFEMADTLSTDLVHGATHLLTSVPPNATGDPVLSAATGAILANRQTLTWIGYLSTTAVYGDHQGGWVDETTPSQPSSPRAHRRVTAETAWLDLYRRYGLPVHIFRLVGIYGPDDNTLRDVHSQKAQRIVKPGQVFCRIHVDDIACVLQASMSRPRPGAIYNVCDDEPAPPQDVIAFACQLQGLPLLPEIPFHQAPLSAMAKTFWADCKRVSNRLLHEELGVTLRYPTYREGLRALTREKNIEA